VTRVGMVVAAGVNGAAWPGLLADPRPAVVTQFSTDELPTRVGFEVGAWSAERFWTSRAVSYYTRSAQFALKAAEECLEAVGPAERSSLGVVIGSQFSTIHHCHKLLDEPEMMTPIKFLGSLPSSTPTNVSIACGLHGISTAISSSVAGLDAIRYAVDLIDRDYGSAILAGGAEELSFDVYAGCHIAGAFAASPRFVPGEGSAVLLLESISGARAAGREPLATVAGSGTAYAPGIVPGFDRPDGVAAGRHAIEQALAAAGVSAGDVGAVITAANGHPDADRLADAIAAGVFDGDVPCVALKQRTGELFGAFGAVATAVATLALVHQVLPGVGRAVFDTILVHDFSCEGNHAALVLTRAARS
jgi:3-oxoacyl-(acyl-carrier-protein) synthase